MAMDDIGMARDVLGMEERRVERAEACRRLHEVKLDGGSHEMLSAIARAVLPDATTGWTVGACERLRAHLVWLLGAGMPEIGALGEDVDKHPTMDGCGPQIGSQCVWHAYMDVKPRIDWNAMADELDVFTQLVRGFAEQVGEDE